MEGCAMGQVLHGCATTTEAIRRAIQNSQESLRALSKRYGINPKTVAKWKKRGSVADLSTGPKEPKSGMVPPCETASQQSREEDRDRGEDRRVGRDWRAYPSDRNSMGPMGQNDMGR